ncbi:MAG: bifunctional (p)ppGpp synthetase/guanosine-3',5'-bis(diphosphate) 3'-pyrophosphohydrolase [Bacteroidaceae bacterium]|nr:bifunctional (p)ppGpp synthetase/guanosine-3',5'-bis(diphosphate) 3'-pyrophosphohydrolase [Bacteroidaceae bacterium]
MEHITDIQIQEKADEVFKVLKERGTTEQEIKKVISSYRLAAEAHYGQKRKSGEPYIVHPIAVAKIVAKELQLDTDTVCAAFLHDVVEDTPYTIDEIRDQFGSNVAFLVKVVTKQKKANYEMSKQLDNFKQMLDSVQYDIRAILIKLADRMHNMRTLSSMKPDKQMKIAGETDYFYAPLANRLGLYSVKTELENLSFRYRCPHEYNKLETLIQQDKTASEAMLQNFNSKISDILNKNKVPFRIYTEYRMPYSLWRKMIKSGKDFKHLENRHITHIVFPDILPETEKNTCLKIYSLLTDIFKEKPGGIANYIDSPKENGYQSFHVKLLSDHGTWEEIHISSERMIRTSQLGAMADRTENNIRKWIEKFKSVLKDVALNSQEGGFIESVVTSFYNDDIMVFSPKGRPVVLPQRATALDFAFEIHNRIGEHAQYARINGRVCSVKTVLKRGDCVEIGVNENCHPQDDWIKHVLTYKAKRFLNSYIKKHTVAKTYERCTVCNPLPGDELIGFKCLNSKLITIHRRNCSRAISLASKDGDSIVSVDFSEDENVLYPVKISIIAIDRYHLLCDLIDCITNVLKLSIISLKTTTIDQIVNCTIVFSVHSYNELQHIIRNISEIKGVDEVHQEKCEIQ